MSNPDTQDDQSLAEGLDESALGAEDVGDIGEDVVREDFPPDRLQGIDRPSPVEVPDELPPADDPVTGLLSADDDPDEEVAVQGDAQRAPAAEEAAVHETDAPPAHEEDSYLDDPLER
jgi:hypothetical protein